jgi:hypothetical protein
MFLGRYLISACRIGEGGNGCVYEATDMGDGPARKVAVKVAFGSEDVLSVRAYKLLVAFLPMRLAGLLTAGRAERCHEQN